MDVFINTIDPEKFGATNGMWNDLHLNAPSNIGMVTDLINEREFKCKEEWEEYYYIAGRSKEYLAEVGQILYNYAKQTLDISLEECVESVRFRTICETWNGLKVTEPNTINTLNIVFDNKFTFRKTNGNFDYDYAVDYEMMDGDKLLCGIQIKPPSYMTSEKNSVVIARKANEKKYKKYFNDFNVKVFTIAANSHGCITSTKELTELINLINNL